MSGQPRHQRKSLEESPFAGVSRDPGKAESLSANKVKRLSPTRFE